jgi:hypothetical protein
MVKLGFDDAHLEAIDARDSLRPFPRLRKA